MKKLILVFLLWAVAAFALGSLRKTMFQAQASSLSTAAEWRKTTNGLADLVQTAAALRADITQKIARLRQTSSHSRLSPELLKCLEGNTRSLPEHTWMELRSQLGLGWDVSPDYVLVNKRVLSQLDLDLLNGTFNSFMHPAKTVLALTPQEQSGIEAAVQDVRASVLSRVQSSAPSGDIVANYTLPPMRPDAELTLSNRFFAGFAASVGQDRAHYFADSCWLRLRRALVLPGSDPIELIVHRTAATKEPQFTYEIEQGNSVTTGKVHYATYPSMWFDFLIQGGWQAIAQREGFELPTNFPPLSPRFPPLTIGQ